MYNTYIRKIYQHNLGAQSLERQVSVIYEEK